MKANRFGSAASLPKPPIPKNESARVAALRAYDILDTAEEEIFDAITRAAASVCSTPMASLTLVDRHRQWFKAQVGMRGREDPRDISFCAHAINGDRLFVVPDASLDVRFRRNPLVAGNPGLHFYAGAPLVASGGLALGTLCVLDVVPRTLTGFQEQTLQMLAASVMRIFNLRRNLGITVLATTIDPTSDGVTIAAGAPGGPTILYANDSFLRFTGYDYHETINQMCTFPVLDPGSGVHRALADAVSHGRMTTAETQLRTKSGALRCDRMSFTPYVDEAGNLLYIVSNHRDTTSQNETDTQAQQLHAMRTTMATVDHVVKNFMNAAQLFAGQVASGQPIDPRTQGSFQTALENTRRQLAAIHRMPAFRHRPTPFGVSILDTREGE